MIWWSCFPDSHCHTTIVFHFSRSQARLWFRLDNCNNILLPYINGFTPYISPSQPIKLSKSELLMQVWSPWKYIHPRGLSPRSCEDRYVKLELYTSILKHSLLDEQVSNLWDWLVQIVVKNLIHLAIFISASLLWGFEASEVKTP